ncbi:MAG: hypothetical protein ABI596_12220 [Pyrinomonadaceae bacterium]
MAYERRFAGRQCLLFACAVLLAASQASIARATPMNISIRVQSSVPPRLVIQGEHEGGMQTWSFRKTYGSVMGLGERITGLMLTDRNGKTVSVRKLGPGQYQAEKQATHFYYEVELDPAIRSGDAAYVSWLTSERGLLLPGDLLPTFTPEPNRSRQVARVSFELPNLWLIATSESRINTNEFDISEPDRAVFFISKDLRQSRARLGRMEFSLCFSGEWDFSAEEGMTVARRIVESYTHSVGAAPAERAMLILSPFPNNERAGRWSAETRGTTVVLLSGRQPARSAALVQLSTPLTHELFHLWVPNGLALDGDYDWFYEGFTIYQAMRTAQQLDLLTFQDLLNAVGRAFDTYLSAPERDTLSLMEASKRRWTTSPSLIYQKAMLVALIYDLTLRTRSRGKQSLENVYRELFRRYRSGSARTEANSAVLSVLNNVRGMEGFASTYLESASMIDLPAVLAPFGLRVEKIGSRSHVLPAQALTRDQRDLLRGLGYNSDSRGSYRNH